MRRISMLVGAALVAAGTAAYGGYYVNEVADFVGGSVQYAVAYASPVYKMSTCALWTAANLGGYGSSFGSAYSQVCGQRPRWGAVGGHDRLYPGTLVERIGRQVQDSTTTGCINETTTLYRYRLTSATPGETTACMNGYSEVLSASVTKSNSTCGDNTVTRDDGENFSLSFAAESIPSQQWRYYRTRLYGAVSSLSITQDACYRVWWH